MAGIYGSTVLNERVILKEMYFSKKDLQNPKTIEKINKKLSEPTIFKGMRVFIDALLIIFNIIIAVGTLGIGLIFTINKSMDISIALQNYYPNKKDKTLIKFKEKNNELLKISEERLKNSSDIKEQKELKEIINNCKNVQKVLIEKDKEIKDIMFQTEIDKAEEYIYNLINWFESKNNNGHDVYFITELFNLGLNIYIKFQKNFL